jgi:glutamyl-tRNA reductase
MELLLVGLNHKTAPVDIREKLSFPEKIMPGALKSLREKDGIAECMIISTCNRVEIVVGVDDPDVRTRQVKEYLRDLHRLPLEDFDPHLYTLTSLEVISHVFQVAASLDSMIVGEPQILGQLKDAYAQARKCEVTGVLLNNVLPRAFKVAKRVRTETGIGKRAISVSFAAVELAKKIFGDISSKSVLVLGAGEMSDLVAQHLLGNGVDNVYVSNRTRRRAEEMAGKFNGRVIPYESLIEELYRIDILIASTGAPHFVIRREHIARAINLRKGEPMFLIDIAVPRNIEPSINEIDNVFLYDIDDLQSVVKANLKEREKEARMAMEIIGQEVLTLWRRLTSLEVSPTIVALREEIETIRKKEVERALARMNGLSQRERGSIEGLTRAIINKILHRHITTLKNPPNSGEVHSYVEAIQALFGLEPPEKSE